MSMIGKTLGNFTLEAQIGAGGMGEVYQAKDTKLGRDVAIKVLPQEFAQDTDRIARFQREAKLLASLNHPNIAAIYGLEKADDTHFLVMELIEGDTLADRIKSGAIPVEESLKLGLQIAEALEAAHEKGVIHRDLKPANIKVTPDGKVKVLDFGLAKAYAGDSENLNLSNSPTLSDMATQQGLILGTAAYMSPEQARGKPVDKRTDVWAFGCVLYEMLTGKATFQGEDVTEILAAVVKSEVNLDLLPVNIHPRVREVLSRCLQKEQKKRYGGIGEAQYEIERVLADPGGVFAQPVSKAESRINLRSIISWVAAAVILTAIIVGAVIWKMRTPEPRQVMRSEYVLPEDQQLILSNSGLTELAVSPDGSQFAYSTTEGIYIRSMNELDARLISGTDPAAQSLFFSPDGQYIGYFSQYDQKLKSISISGVAPIDLCDATWVISAYWPEDNTIVYSDNGSGVCRIPAKGGTPEVLVERQGIANGRLLPDGKSVMFTDIRSQPYKTIVQSLDTGEQTVICEDGAGWYLPTGHFIYWAEGSMFAVPFDLDKLKFAGGAVNVMPEGGRGVAISDSGTLVYVPGVTNHGRINSRIMGMQTMGINLVWVDRQGNVEEISAPQDRYRNPRISPDRTKVAVTVRTEEGLSDIHILDLNSGVPSRLTFNENSTDPLWTPDGQKIVFVAGDEDNMGIYWRAADNTGKDVLLASMSEGESLLPQSWADDGKTLVIIKEPFSSGGFGSGQLEMMRGMRGGSRRPTPKRSPGSDGSSTSEETDFVGTDIGTISMEGDPQWKQLLHLDEEVSDLQISPNGRWMAYSSQSGIFVYPFPDVDSGGPWQVYKSGTVGCLWSQNGRELIFANMEDSSLSAVEVETDSTFKFGKSEVLFNTVDIGLGRGASFSFDITPDGKQFLMLQPPEFRNVEALRELFTEQRPRKIIIVTNWFEELKDRVPVE